MAKSKKAAPKKAPTKKTTAKKPVAKKAAPKTAALKKAKKPKTGISKAAKRLKTKKNFNAKSPATALQQGFTDSLIKLENYWSKYATTLKRELDALVNKHKKETQKKQSPKQAEKLNLLEKEIASKQDALDEASFAAAKFVALSNKIAEFENEWLAQLTDNAVVTPTPSAPAAKSKTNLKPKGLAKLSDDLQTIAKEWDDEQEPDEALEDDLDDIFMPQDDLSEFEVIEDFSVTNEDDIYEDDEP